MTHQPNPEADHGALARGEIVFAPDDGGELPKAPRSYWGRAACRVWLAQISASVVFYCDRDVTAFEVFEAWHARYVLQTVQETGQTDGKLRYWKPEPSIPTASDAIVALLKMKRNKCSNSAWASELCAYFELDKNEMRRKAFPPFADVGAGS